MFRLCRRGAHPPIAGSGARGSMAGSPTRTTGRRALPGGSILETTGAPMEVTGPLHDPSGAPTRTSGAPTPVTDRHGSMIAPPMEMLAMPPRSSARDMIGTARQLRSESLQPESPPMELGSETLQPESQSRKLRWQSISTMQAPVVTRGRGSGVRGSPLSFAPFGGTFPPPARGWRGDRVAEGTRLLSGRRSKAYRGFESLPLRRRNRHASRGLKPGTLRGPA